MEDRKIIDLYFARDEMAIEESRLKYGRLLFSIANSILNSRHESEECENDTYYRAWSSIPPTLPASLSAYLSKITRNIAINRYRHNKRRRSAEMDIILDELSEVVPATEADPTEQIALRDALEDFVGGLDLTKRLIFLKRYFYMISIRDIALDMSLGVGTVKSHLSRTRIALHKHLTERGITV